MVELALVVFQARKATHKIFLFHSGIKCLINYSQNKNDPQGHFSDKLGYFQRVKYLSLSICKINKRNQLLKFWIIGQQANDMQNKKNEIHLQYTFKMEWKKLIPVDLLPEFLHRTLTNRYGKIFSIMMILKDLMVLNSLWTCVELKVWM